MLYAIYALKLFPSHDAYNGYIAGYHPLIVNLLQGRIMLWDPVAACGSPFFLTFMTAGIFDPTFAVSIMVGKLFSLNVLQTYWTWIMLRNIPILFGAYWLMKQYCRHRLTALFSTIFFFFTISFCLLRDAVFFIIYWPLLLACLTHFFRSLMRGKPSIPTFLGVILFLGLSLQLYNPAYTLILLGSIAFSRCIVAPRSVAAFLGSLRRFRLGYWIAAAIVLILLLSPSIVILQNYRRGEHFAYIRTHQAAANIHHPISGFLNDSLDYMEVNPEGSPIRYFWELTSCVFPFYYNGLMRQEGTVYFGFLGLLGVLAGIFFRRNKSFLIYFLSSLFMAFLMSPNANGFLRFVSPVFPFFKMFNQRHLLYPAFIICSTIAASFGLRLLLDLRLMRKIAKRITIRTVLDIGIFLIILCIFFLWFSGAPTGLIIHLLGRKILRFYVIFLLAMVGIAALLRLSVRNSRWYYPYILFISAVTLIDLGFFCKDLSRYYHRNEGVLAKSHMLRRRLNLQYQPYRAPLLPIAYGTDVFSIAHLMDLRTALPAYWHGDVIFTSKRYYYLFSSLSPAKLKHILGIDTPIIRTFAKSMAVSNGENALLKIENMSDLDLLDTVVLEEPEKPPYHINEKIEDAISQDEPSPKKTFRHFVTPKEIDQSFYIELYDNVLSIPVEKCEEVTQGVYHNKMFRIPFELPVPTTSGGEVDVSRCFFPDFPYSIDINGKIYYFNNGLYLTDLFRRRQDRSPSLTMMQAVPGKGILLECQRNDKLTLPKKVYFLKDRIPPSDEVSVISMDVNRIEVLTEQKEKTILYYGDIYDSNWKATIDNQPAKILIANYVFKAVEIPPGRHHVVFEYRVPYLGLSLALYYLCILSITTACIFLTIKWRHGLPPRHRKLSRTSLKVRVRP